jgi:nucleotide-binding universal stress UspA family protein
MNFHTKIILHPSDFSENSKVALRYAIDQLQIKNARLVVLCVHELNQGKHSIKGESLEKELEEVEKKIKADAEAIVRSVYNGKLPIPVPEFQVAHHHSVYQAILDAVVKMDPYMVVMGKRGTSSVHASELGSVSHHLSEKIKHPLLIVPLESEDPL